MYLSKRKKTIGLINVLQVRDMILAMRKKDYFNLKQ